MKKVVKQDDGCWLWTGYTNEDGYGTFWYEGENWQAHRWSFVYIGKQNLVNQACHNCDTPQCVNPAHLFDGTQRDNMHDKHEKKRQPRRYEKARAKAIAEGRKVRVGTRMVDPQEV